MTVRQAKTILQQFKEWEHGFQGRTRILTKEYYDAEKVVKEAGRTPPQIYAYSHIEGDCTCTKCKKKFFESMVRPALVDISRAAYKETCLLLKVEFAEGYYWLLSEDKRYRLNDTMNQSISIIKHFKEQIIEFFNTNT